MHSLYSLSPCFEMLLGVIGCSVLHGWMWVGVVFSFLIIFIWHVDSRAMREWCKTGSTDLWPKIFNLFFIYIRLFLLTHVFYHEFENLPVAKLSIFVLASSMTLRFKAHTAVDTYYSQDQDNGNKISTSKHRVPKHCAMCSPVCAAHTNDSDYFLCVRGV